mmetsp:Transcript_86086/g.152043  ORF Transcript_86086/g.152043 Transcript_86086/m.152043 type:complete len:1127 (-) Transcript_86086:71-3451(-)
MVAEVMPPVEPGGAADLESAALLLYSQKFAKAPSEELSEYDTIYEGMDDVNCDRSEDTIMPSSRAELLSEIMPCAKKPSATVHSMPGPRRQYQSRTGGTPMNYIPIASRNCFRAPSQGYGGVPDMPADSETERFDLDADVGVCDQCGLPLGDVSYHSEGNGEGPLVHAECYVDLTLRSLKKDEQEYQQEESALKSSRRDEYDIGWNVECIPRNMVHAGKLDCQLVPQGMCCLKTDEGFTKLSCWPTIEPAAAVNLEYLSIALKVRGNEGREPMFSLDPVEATDSLDKNRMQVKRFEPEWLAGTSVGDVLFQADYHLKELSMGEYSQPVVGMKSCFDLSEIEGQKDKKWNAREWFLVRDAKVNLSEDNVLIPSVMMGIEAREQTLTAHGLEDAPLTRKDHPMVKYADAFTRNFDLIAERKSVIYHLRELAKASVMAKFLMDAQVQMDESWFNLATAESDCCSLEIPQLWNERLYSKIRAQDGEVVKEDDNHDGWHGIYGGVQFGLQKFDLGTVVPPPPPPVPPRLKGLLADPTKKPPLVLPKQRLTLKANTIELPPPPAGVTPPGAAAQDEPEPEADTTDAAASLSTVTVAPTALKTAPRKPVSLLGVAPRPTTALLSQLPPVRQISSYAKMPDDITAPVPGAAAIAPIRPPSLRPITPAAATAAVTPTTLAALSGRGLPPPPTIGGPRRAAPSITPIKGTAPVPGGRAALLSGVPQIRSLKPIEPPTLAPGATLSAAAGLSAAPMPSVATAGLSMMAPAAMLQSSTQARGVDLNLDQFNLSTAEHQTGEVLGSVAEEVSVPIGASFWSDLDLCATDSVFKKDDRKLLQEIFNPHLSDRREEGNHFTVPDSRFSYIGKLRCLIQEEADVRQKRKDHFLSTEFVAGNAGPIFPQSWTSNVELKKTERAQKAVGARIGRLQARSDYNDRAGQIVESTTPIFDKSTEDGMRFRIYRVGSVEVRTTQQHGEEEAVGVVFSIRDPRSQEAGSGQKAQFNIDDSELVLKVTEYVERASSNGNETEFCYYIALETQEGSIIVSEKLGGHAMASWEENPSDVEDRNSLARVVRSGDCRVAGVSVRDMKGARASASFGEGATSAWSQRRCRLYAQDMFIRAMGGLDAVLLANAKRE